jgi:hypothetical protein
VSLINLDANIIAFSPLVAALGSAKFGGNSQQNAQMPRDVNL